MDPGGVRAEEARALTRPVMALVREQPAPGWFVRSAAGTCSGCRPTRRPALTVLSGAPFYWRWPDLRLRRVEGLLRALTRPEAVAAIVSGIVIGVAGPLMLRLLSLVLNLLKSRRQYFKYRWEMRRQRRQQDKLMRLCFLTDAAIEGRDHQEAVHEWRQMITDDRRDWVRDRWDRRHETPVPEELGPHMGTELLPVRLGAAIGRAREPDEMCDELFEIFFSRLGHFLLLLIPDEFKKEILDAVSQRLEGEHRLSRRMKRRPRRQLLDEWCQGRQDAIQDMLPEEWTQGPFLSHAEELLTRLPDDVCGELRFRVDAVIDGRDQQAALHRWRELSIADRQRWLHRWNKRPDKLRLDQLDDRVVARMPDDLMQEIINHMVDELERRFEAPEPEPQQPKPPEPPIKSLADGLGGLFGLTGEEVVKRMSRGGEVPIRQEIWRNEEEKVRYEKLKRWDEERKVGNEELRKRLWRIVLWEEWDLQKGRSFT